MSICRGLVEGPVQRVQRAGFLAGCRSRGRPRRPHFLGGGTDVVSYPPLPLKIFFGLKALRAFLGGGFGLGASVVSYEPLAMLTVACLLGLFLVLMLGFGLCVGLSRGMLWVLKCLSPGVV